MWVEYLANLFCEVINFTLKIWTWVIIIGLLDLGTYDLMGQKVDQSLSEYSY